MAMLNKNEINSTKHTISTISKLDTSLSNIVTIKNTHENDIKRNYEVLRTAQTASILESMDIEKINVNKDGIRIANLKNAGILNVYQVSQLSYEQLCRINGIGEASASKIINNARMLRLSAEKTAQVVLSADNKNPQTEAMIKSLYFLIKNDTALKNAEHLYNTYHDAIQQNVVQAQLLTSNLRWMFASKKNKDASSAASRWLIQLLQGEFGEGAEQVCEEYESKGNRVSQVKGPIISVSEAWNDFSRNSAPYYAMLETIGGGVINQSDEYTGLPEELLQSIEHYELDVSQLKANLRRYQLFGTKYILHQEKVLLGDEMGLGKTMQAIAAFCHLASLGKKHFLVVCPLSVLVNWEREIQTQSDLKTIAVYGEDRAMEMTQWSADGGVAITTFETLNKIIVPEAVTVDMMVVDEAHYIKNPEAMRTKSVLNAAAKADRILFMTGTPLENKVEEMSFLIRCLNPQIAEQIQEMKQLTDAPQFRELIAPLYLRRVREDVLKELPELVEKEQWGLMNAEELEQYKASLVEGNFMTVRQVSWTLSDITKSTKAKRLMEICEDARESGRKLIIFSFFKTVLAGVSKILGEYCSGVIDGSVPASERQQMIDKFTADKPGSALVCQIQAGGVGLNIQAASVVVFCEPQIKPSLETQAIARAYRMGQSQSVVVHRLLMKDSVDEKILSILHQKSELFEHFADESVIGEMDIQINENTVMSSIVEEERKRLGLKQESGGLQIP